jgi:hypothetical protein
MPQNPLPFTIQTQQCSNWCWAAVVSSIAAFANASQQPQQCEVVDQEAFSPNDPSPGCCDPGNACVPKDSSCPCNRTCSVETALQDYGLLTGSTDGPSTDDFAAITQQIDQSAVVVLQVVDRSNADLVHAMVAYGYLGPDNLQIADPASGASKIYSYRQLLEPSGDVNLSNWQLQKFLTTSPAPS